MAHFDLSDRLEITIAPIGRNAEPVLLIDDVMQDWQELQTAAVQADFTPAVGGATGFPGLRAPLPTPYAKALLQRLDNTIREVFFADRDVQITRFDCNFSLITKLPADLHPMQKIPHLDIASPDRIAILHYLCPPHFGGTAFYRQRDTGLERVGPGEKQRWHEARKADLAALTAENAYPDDSTPGYGRIASFDARPDRLIAYRSHNLHSGVVNKPEILSSDPAIGRLTANFFVSYADSNAQG